MIEKKLVIIGSNHTAALELVYKKLLEKNGYSTVVFPSQNLFLAHYNHSLINKFYYRLGLSNIIDSIQMELKEFIIVEKPSIVIVFKGMEIIPSTIGWIKQAGIRIYNYNPDHPFVFSGKGSGNKYVTESIKLFDYYISYADDAVSQLKELGVESFKLPFGFDADGFDFIEINPLDEVLKTCFIGNADKYRVEFLNDLANLGLQIDVYGENWKKFKLSNSINVSSSLYGQEFWETLQKYAVQLNLLRPHNINTHNMRSFDIPGSGGIMLAPLTNDHQFYFEEDVEIFLFDSLDIAFDKAKQLLNLSFDERLLIRRKARERALGFHTYGHRIKQLINFFEIGNEF
jgi:spore maturation protein CgeB